MRRGRLIRRGVLAALALLGFAEQPAAQEATALFGASEDRAAQTLVIHGSADIAPFSAVLEGFVAATPGLRIVYEQRSTNDIYARAALACARGEASADLLISSSIDQQIKLANDGCAQPWRPQGSGAPPPWARWRDEVVGLTREPAVMVYNRTLVPAERAPRSRFDLIDLLRSRELDFEGRIATYDIEGSGLGYLFAFADAQQATTFGRLIEAFGRNRVAVETSSAALIEGVARGDYLIAYNILGSYALARAAEDPTLAVVAPTDYTLILSRAAVVPKGASSPETASAFIDFALSAYGQALLRSSGLVVDIDEDARFQRDESGRVSAILQPIVFSPVLLVGLDREKRRIFVETWRSAVYPFDPSSTPR